MRTSAAVLGGVAVWVLIHAASVQAQQAVAAAAAPVLAEIVVYGAGETRQVQEVSAVKLALEAPSSSPLKALQLLPSVNFQSADPFGAYEWSTRITVRGFNQTQLGFTLDALPLGDMSYGNHNGLHISRAIINENVGRIVIAQGTSALGTASTSNLGGTLTFFTLEPKDEMGFSASATYGSENTTRLYARGDSGDLGSGTRLFVSGAYQRADKWKGDGLQRHYQMNARLSQDIGAGKFTAFLNWSDRRENDYQDLSLGMISRLGYDWDNFAPDFARAVLVAQIAGNRGDTGVGPTAGVGTVYPAPITSVDDAYYDASGLRKDWLYGAAIEMPVTDTVSFDARFYGHNNEGQGLWYTPYVRSPSGVPIAIRTTEYDIDRYGVLASAKASFDALTIDAGLWFEKNNFGQARRFYGLDNVTTGPSRASTDFQSDPFVTQWEYDFDSKTRQFHLGGTYETDLFIVNAGFKTVRVSNAVKPVTGFAVVAFPADAIVAKKDFLPQAGVTFKLSEEHQLFASFSKNLRAFVGAATGAAPFATSAVGFAGIRGSLKPETTTTFEAGWRFNTGMVSGVAAVYHVTFKDRLLAVSTGPGIVGAPVALQNVGDVRSQGIETAVTVRPMDALSATVSASYNDNEYQDNVVDGAGVTVAAIKGKTVPDSPKTLLKGEIAYDDPLFFIKADISHMSKRYFTYLNDRSVPSQTLVNLGGGVKLGGLIGAGEPEAVMLQLNVTNLLDKEYVATIGSNGFGNSGDNQTLLAGAPRQLFATLRAQF